MTSMHTTIVGNLCAAPVLRQTESGVAVANFDVAITPRVLKNGDWKDGVTTFIPCTVWRHLAQNLASSTRKGTRVIVVGTLRTEQWDGQDGETKSRIVMDVTSAGVELSWSIASVQRTTRLHQEDDDEWDNASPYRPQ